MFYEKLFQLILEQRKDLNEDKLNRMVKDKIDELGGLVNEDAAILLLAKEMGIDIPYNDLSNYSFSPMKIGDLVEGLRNVSLLGIVYKIGPLFSLPVKEGERKIQKIYIADESGKIGLTLWDSQILDAYKKGLKLGAIIQVKRAKVVKYRNRIELSLSKNGEILIKRSDSDLSYQKFIPKNYRGDDFNILALNMIEGTSYKHMSVLIGIDKDGRYIRVLFPRNMSTYLKNISLRNYVTLQNIIIKKREKEIIEGIFSPYSFIYKSSTEFKVERRSDNEKFDIDIYGDIVSLKPYRKWRLLLTLYHDKKFIEIIIRSSPLIRKILKDRYCLSRIHLKYVDRIDTYSYRSNLWSSISLSEIEEEKYRKTLVFNAKDFSEIKGTLIDFSIKLYIYSKDEGFRDLSYSNTVKDSEEILFLPLLEGVLDDGSGRLNIISNCSKLFEDILYVKVNSILNNHYSISLIKSILDYVVQDSIGKEVIVKGKVIKGDNRQYMICREIFPI